MRAPKDNHFNNSFSQHHQDQAREVSLEAQVVSLEAQVVSLVVFLEEVLAVFLEAQVASLEVLEEARGEVLAAIPQCQWDRLLPLLPKCNNYPQASHSKVLVV